MGKQKTDLYEAVEKNQFDIVERLLKENALVDAREDGYFTPGWTSLMLAAQKGYNVIVEMLLSYGADVNAQSKTGWTPLFSAVYDNQLSVAKQLITKGADVNMTRFDGESPLFAATGLEHAEELICLLRDAKAISFAPCPICSCKCFVCNSKEILYNRAHSFNPWCDRYEEIYKISGSKAPDSHLISSFSCFACQDINHFPDDVYNVSLTDYHLSPQFEELPDKLYAYEKRQYGYVTHSTPFTNHNYLELYTMLVERKSSGEKIKALQELKGLRPCPLCHGKGGIPVERDILKGSVFVCVLTRKNSSFIDWLLSNGITALMREFEAITSGASNG